MAKRREKRECKAVVLEPDAAGIDIGAEEIYVAVPPDRDEESVRRFSSFTCDLHALADWLEQCQIRTVAMESTGVYWIPLFQILEARGLEVFLVNAHYLKSVPGRKSDVCGLRPSGPALSYRWRRSYQYSRDQRGHGASRPD